jgi:hypothetical protein
LDFVAFIRIGISGWSRNWNEVRLLLRRQRPN